jgi:hypothetical protein
MHSSPRVGWPGSHKYSSASDTPLRLPLGHQTDAQNQQQAQALLQALHAAAAAKAGPTAGGPGWEEGPQLAAAGSGSPPHSAAGSSSGGTPAAAGGAGVATGGQQPAWRQAKNWSSVFEGVPALSVPSRLRIKLKSPDRWGMGPGGMGS